MNPVVYSVWLPVTNILTNFFSDVIGLSVSLGWYHYCHFCGRILPLKSLDINPFALLLGYMHGKPTVSKKKKQSI
jgi:hypothetical protein